MLEILLDNKDGNVWDISELVSSVTWKTVRIGRPGSLDLTLVKHKELKIEPGAVIRIKSGQRGVFYGYVFTIERSQDDDIKLVAYDQIRYLLSNDTYVFSNVTATDVIKRIAGDLKLRVGSMEDTKHRIPSLVEDNQKILDIICKALDLTLISTGQIYVFYDDFGALTLRNARNMTVDISVGDESLMYGYDFKRSIDDDTYNRVKLVKDNKDTGKREVYIAQDSKNIAKWGRLQLFQKVDERLNEAQIKQMLDRLIQLKNRETKTFKIDAIGDLRIRAGCYVPIFVEELGIRQHFLVDECTHKWEGSEHTMTLDLKVV